MVEKAVSGTLRQTAFVGSSSACALFGYVSWQNPFWSPFETNHRRFLKKTHPVQKEKMCVSFCKGKTSIHSHTHTHTHTSIHPYKYVHIYTSTPYSYIHTSIHAHTIHAHIHPFILISIHAYIHEYVHACVHPCTHTPISMQHRGNSVCVCVCVCVFVFSYANMQTSVGSARRLAHLHRTGIEISGCPWPFRWLPSLGQECQTTRWWSGLVVCGPEPLFEWFRGK